MSIKWSDFNSLDETVINIINELKKRNITIYGDFIKNDYIYDYDYNTISEDFLMEKEKYNNLVVSKDIPHYNEENYSGIRDFKGSLLFSRKDNDLEEIDRNKFAILFMIVAIAHDVYEGQLPIFPERLKVAYEYIKTYGYDLNWSSKCCFPFDIKGKNDSEEDRSILLNETILEAICNYTMFSAHGIKMVM